jgi:transglutaminase-like putative cysteine protease
MGCIGQPEVEEEQPEGEKDLLTVGEEAYYAHMILGNPVGYTHYAVTEPIQYNDEQVLVVTAETFLDLELGGAPYTMTYESTEYYTNMLNPKYYKLSLAVAEVQSDIECSFENGVVTEKIESPDLSEEREISIDDNTYLLDSNMFHHYVFLFRTLEPADDTDVAVSLFMPQLMRSVTTTVKFKEEESGTFYAEATILEQEHKFWVTPQGELLALEIPSQSFRMELSDASITEQVESVELIELLSTPSNVAFDDPFSVDYLKIRITTEILAEPVNKDFLSNNYQTFSGTTTESSLDGIFEIRTQKFSGPGDDYPLQEPQQYLVPETKIESDDPSIKAQAEEITKDSQDSWEASQRIAQWVYQNIGYKITGEGAKKTLETKKGDCGPHSYLTVALLRSIGIPSRIVGGVVYDRIGGTPIFGQHYWTEVFITGEWIPFDSTTGQYGYLDATHVRLFELGGIQEIEIEVLEYTQEEPEVVIEEKEALLNVGEYYTYRFVIDDTEFGYTDYRITKKELYEGVEAFYVELSLDLDLKKVGGPVNLALDAVLYVAGDVMPLDYHVDALVDSEEQTIDCTFRDGKVQYVAVAGGETVEQEITLEDRTYLMQSNVIGLWALVYRSLQLEEGQTYKVPVFFAENYSKFMVNIEVVRTETIVVGGKSYEVFVCDVPLFREIDYVTRDGLLVKIDLPSQNGFIELVESSESFFII